MHHVSRVALSFAVLVSAGACDRIQKAPESKNAAAVDPVAADMDRMEAGIRIAAANRRIDELERKVGALKATPEKVDLELLTQRVAAFEAKSAGDQVTEPQATSDPKAPASGTPRSGSGGRRAPTAPPR